MKKTITFFLLSSLAIAGNSQSPTTKPLMAGNVKMLSAGKGYLNAINMRAVRDFMCRYEKATDAVWYGVHKGFVVRFFVDSNMARSAYKSNGNWIYTIKQYPESKMLKSVRHLVKSTYYDYEITLVEEIEVPDENVKYVVHLQDKISWKNVLVANGQLNLIEDKKKL